MRRILHKRGWIRLLACLLVVKMVDCVAAQAVSLMPIDDAGGQSSREDNWLHTSLPRYHLAQRELHLMPQGEPQPAMSVVLIPNEFDLVDGNAAVQYLQALGFAEQQAAREAMSEFYRKSRQALQDAEQDINLAEPYSWLQTPPDKLPIQRVKEYLAYSSWQQRYLHQAVQRRSCDFDRNLRAVDNPVGYLLPEIQSMRELARLQSMRFRLAIAEDRPHDAVAIFGQQLALGHHLDSEKFLVSNLVGIACAAIGWSDAVYLTEHPGSPNLYWAIAALPQPLISMRDSLAYEREFFFEQLKSFREIDEVPQPPVYWQRFVAGLPEELGNLGFAKEDSPIRTPAGLTGLIAAAYPGAKLFLVNEMGMNSAEIEALPVPQVVFLAVRRLHERLRDEFFKVQYVPAPLRGSMSPDETLKGYQAKYGWITSFSDLLLPAIKAAVGARERLQQQLALLQTIESIRDHLASQDGKLPEALSDLRLPAPYDPLTLEPFEYHLEADGRARLSGAIASNLKYEFLLVPVKKK